MNKKTSNYDPFEDQFTTYCSLFFNGLYSVNYTLLQLHPHLSDGVQRADQPKKKKNMSNYLEIGCLLQCLFNYSYLYY